MKLNEILVDTIKRNRVEKHISQDKLSEKSGLDPKYINKLENGRFNLTIPTLEKILDGLEIDYIDFFDALEKKSDSSIDRLINTLNTLDSKQRDKVIDSIQSLIENLHS